MSNQHHELRELAEKWSQQAQEASEEGNMEYSIGLSVAADELREVLEDE